MPDKNVVAVKSPNELRPAEYLKFAVPICYDIILAIITTVLINKKAERSDQMTQIGSGAGLLTIFIAEIFFLWRALGIKRETKEKERS